MSLTIPLPEARRLAVASQGFETRPARPMIAHLRRLANQIHAFQIDSVNVLARAQYVPAFARLGPYPMHALDSLAYRRRELFEYWGHAACLLRIALYPFVRYRMQRHSEQTQKYMRSRRGAYTAKVYDEVGERGPLTAAELSNPGQCSGSCTTSARFLLSDTLVARCDLKADRARRVLVVQGAFLEPRQVARRVIADLTAELRQMQAWLELDRIEVGQRGDLAPLLRRAVSTSTRRRASTL